MSQEYAASFRRMQQSSLFSHSCSAGWTTVLLSGERWTKPWYWNFRRQWTLWREWYSVLEIWRCDSIPKETELVDCRGHAECSNGLLHVQGLQMTWCQILLLACSLECMRSVRELLARQMISMFQWLSQHLKGGHWLIGTASLMTRRVPLSSQI